MAKSNSILIPFVSFVVKFLYEEFRKLTTKDTKEH
jgi:hypothetical protein